MITLRTLSLLGLGLLALSAPAAAADGPIADAPGRLDEPAGPAPAVPASDHPAPRLKLARRSFSIANLDQTPIALTTLEVDLYPVSTRWFRAGITAAGGTGDGTMSGNDVSLRYGLVGVAGGLQLPARVTPFLEGNLAGGLLEGSLSSTTAVTTIYARGVDVGAELYTVGRLYLSASVGWLRTTWRGPDTSSLTQASLSGLMLHDLTADSVTFKLGLGI